MRNDRVADADWRRSEFLSSLAQDFIEERKDTATLRHCAEFLSSLAQDFIEDYEIIDNGTKFEIPELSSSGLH